MTTIARKYLVPGRECGDCTACCTDLAISGEGMEKLAGVPCQHCTAAQGCDIYDRRPTLCRDYHCVWRAMPALDESWRPDLSGVLIVWGTAPPGLSSEYAVDLIIVGPAQTVETDRFTGLAAGFVAQGFATFLDIPRGSGFLSTNAFINDLLAPAIAARSREQAKALLRAAYAEMMARPARPVELESDE